MLTFNRVEGPPPRRRACCAATFLTAFPKRQGWCWRYGLFTFPLGQQNLSPVSKKPQKSELWDYFRVINLTIFTCTVRFRSLTNTLLNLVSLRYRPTASHCWIPVSDRTASIPWPKRDIPVIIDVLVRVFHLQQHILLEKHTLKQAISVVLCFATKWGKKWKCR